MKNSHRDYPRLSVNELAEYMVATDTRRHSILRDAKFPKPYITTHYQDARRAICKYLYDPIRNISILKDCESMLNQKIADTSTSSYSVDAARRQIQCLEAVLTIQNLPQYSFKKPTIPRETIDVAGVDVSIQLDLIVVSPKDVRYGGAIFEANKR